MATLEQQAKCYGSLCWKCRNAVPDKQGHGCEWSMHHKPVPGWKTVQSIRKEQPSVRVVVCPKFAPDKPVRPKRKPDKAKRDGKIHFEDEADRMTMEMRRWGI